MPGPKSITEKARELLDLAKETAADVSAPGAVQAPQTPASPLDGMPILKCITDQQGDTMVRKLYQLYVDVPNAMSRYPAFAIALDKLLQDFGGTPWDTEENDGEGGDGEGSAPEDETASEIRRKALLNKKNKTKWEL